MKAAKMPQLESPLPERLGLQNNFTRRTHVAQCPPSDAEAPQIVAICRKIVAECHNPPGAAFAVWGYRRPPKKGQISAAV